MTESVLNQLGLPTCAPGAVALPGAMPYTQEGLRILGAPVGNPAFCLRFSEEIVATVISELEVLSRMPSLQAQHTTATQSTLHRVTHLLRNIPGGELELFGPLGAAYDAAVLAVPARICQQLSLPELQAGIAQQPFRKGGLGYLTWHKTADPAFLASYVHASLQIPSLFPDLGHMFPDVRTLVKPHGSPTAAAPPATAPSSAAFLAARAVTRLTAVAPGVLEAVAPIRGQTPRQLQHSISLLVEDAHHLSIVERLTKIDNPTHPRHQSAYLSSSGDAHTMGAIPGEQTTISNELFSTIARIKLLLPIHPYNGEVLQCPRCHGVSSTSLPETAPPWPLVDPYGDHSLSCKHISGGARTKLRHDQLVQAWLHVIRYAGVSCAAEQEGVVAGSHKRPDVVIEQSVAISQPPRAIWTDVRTNVSASHAICRRSASDLGYANRHSTESQVLLYLHSVVASTQ